MVSILPSERTPNDVFSKNVGQQLSQHLPGAVQQGFQRQMGLNSIDQLQQQLASANGDMSKILPALARAYTLNPALERSGLGQQYLQQARIGKAFGEGNQQTGGVSQQNTQQPQEVGGENESIPERGAFATPSPWNIMTPQDMEAESRRYAEAIGDPNAYNTRYSQLQAQNEAATNQREALEDAALKGGVSSTDLPRFILVNSKLDSRNPSQWVQEGIRNFDRVKANDQKIQNAFIPGIGNALLGRDREESLNKLRPTLLENKKLGLEQEDRKFLADNYLNQAEIESLYHPVTQKQEKSLEKLPKGLFPAETGEQLSYFAPSKENPFISYEEALERDPKGIKAMQDQLTDFFLKNVDNDTSLLALREPIWKEKDYDWRQIGPALREAQKKGLKLNPEQEREATTLDTQPPMQSLPDIFQDLSRIPAFLRGNK